MEVAPSFNVNVAVVSVAPSIASENVALTAVFVATSVAPAVGDVELTAGGVVSDEGTVEPGPPPALVDESPVDAVESDEDEVSGPPSFAGHPAERRPKDSDRRS